jgi:hypothetical protein
MVVAWVHEYCRQKWPNLSPFLHTQCLIRPAPVLDLAPVLDPPLRLCLIRPRLCLDPPLRLCLIRPAPVLDPPLRA